MRKGFTLIEIIVSLALLSIILAVIPQIFGNTILQIGDNGESINKVNLAKSEINIAMTDTDYETVDLTQDIVKVNVLGTDVEVRKIDSKINDSNKIFTVYVPLEPIDEPEITDDALIFIDKNYDGYFNGSDIEVEPIDGYDSELEDYEYKGYGNLVIGRTPRLTNNQSSMMLNVLEKVVIKENINIDAHSILVSSNGLEIGNNSNFQTNNGEINIDSNGNINLGSSSYVESKNGTTLIRAKKDITLSENCQIYSNSNDALNIEGNNINFYSSIIENKNGTITIKAQSDVVLTNNTTINSNANSDMTIDCDNFNINNLSKISNSNGKFLLNAKGDVKVLSGAKIDIAGDNNEISEINANNIVVSGTNIDDAQDKSMINIDRYGVYLNAREDIYISNDAIVKSEGKVDLIAINKINITENANVETKNRPINIVSDKGDVLIDKSIISGDVSETLVHSKNSNVYINNSVIKAKNSLSTIDGKIVKIIGGTNIDIDGGDVSINADELYLAGSSSAITKIMAINRMVELNVKDTIYYGVLGGSNAYVQFNTSNDDYAFNKNKTKFAENYVEPLYKDSDEAYFK